MNQYYQDGKSIDYTPEAAVSAGAFVALGGITGFANLDIAAGELGALCIEGVIKCDKATSEAISVGTVCYWDSTNKCATATATEIFIGTSVYAAAATDTTVCVKLNVGTSAYEASESV